MFGVACGDDDGGTGGTGATGATGGSGGGTGGAACVPPAPVVGGTAQTACRNSFNQLLSQFPVNMDIALDCADPDQPSNAVVTPTLNFEQSFLQTAADTLCPFGIDICVDGATFADVQVRVDALAGATCTSQLSALTPVPQDLPLDCGGTSCPTPVVQGPVGILLPTVNLSCTNGPAPGPIAFCATGLTPLTAVPGAAAVDTWASVSIGFPLPVSFQCGQGLVSETSPCTSDSDCPAGTAGETPFPAASCGEETDGECDTVPLALDPTVDCVTFPVGGTGGTGGGTGGTGGGTGGTGGGTGGTGGGTGGTGGT